MPPISQSTLRARDFVFDLLADQGYEVLNPVQQQFVCVWAACGEVDNGGLWQFFFNTSGDWALDTPAALERFQAPDLARIVRAAIAMFPNESPSTSLELRRREIEALPEEVMVAWDRLSKEFDTASMDGKIEAYIHQNEREIYDNGQQ